MGGLFKRWETPKNIKQRAISGESGEVRTETVESC